MLAVVSLENPGFLAETVAVGINCSCVGFGVNRYRIVQRGQNRPDTEK